jgi:hypothetical protein
MSYEAWQKLAQTKMAEFDLRDRLRERREQERRAVDRPRQETVSYTPAAVTSARNSAEWNEWLDRRFENFADMLGEEVGRITRQERQLMREHVSRVWGIEREKFASDLSLVIRNLLADERGKWRQDIYDIVEEANKVSTNKGEVLPMVRRVTRDDAA